MTRKIVEEEIEEVPSHRSRRKTAFSGQYTDGELDDMVFEDDVAEERKKKQSAAKKHSSRSKHKVCPRYVIIN
jgi:hypothetical protein